MNLKILKLLHLGFMYRDTDFYLNYNYLYRKSRNRKGKVTLLKVSWPIKIAAYLDNYEAQFTTTPSPDKYLAISFLIRPDETEIKVNLPRRIINQPNLLISDLMGYGFYINSLQKKWLIEYLSRQNPKKSMLYVTKPGWTSDLKAFVFTDQTISKDNNLKENLKLINPTNKFNHSGAYKDWQEHVVKPSINNPLFAFALATAFTPILLRFVKMDSFCVNLYGESSKGKTTALQIAASVWGCGSDPSQPDSYIYNWNATGNALNYLASGSNDVLLAIDELGSFVNDSLGQVVYALSGGKSRKGMKSNNQLRDDLTWNMVLLSTSEVSGRQKMEDEGRVYTGQLNRFIDIPVNELNEQKKSDDAELAISDDAELADALKISCSEYYGIAGIKLIETITDYSDGRDDLIKKINKSHKESFDYLMALEELEALDLTPELSRSIRRFALIFTASKLIARGNIVALFELDPTINYKEIDENRPEYKAASKSATQAENALRATLTKVFKAWLKNLNQEPRSSSERILALIEEFIFSNQSKFIKIKKAKKGEPPLPFSDFGYYHEAQKLFLLTGDTFAKACRGFSATEAAKVLDNASVKLLHKQDVERLKAAFSVCTMAGTKKRRFYAIKDSILKDAESKRSL